MQKEQMKHKDERCWEQLKQYLAEPLVSRCQTSESQVLAWSSLHPEPMYEACYLSFIRNFLEE